MSEDKKDLPTQPPESVPNLPTIQGKDLQDYRDFIEAGMPAISSLPRESVPKMLDMYLDGYSHREIARFFRTKIEIVLYHADKGNWYQQLIVSVKEVADSSALKLQLYQNKTPEFYMALGGFIRKNMQVSMDQYKRTGDVRILDTINAALVDKIIKIDSFIKDATSDPKVPATTNINIFGNASVEKKEDSIDVTPASIPTAGSTADVLKAIADLKRKNQAEKK